MTDPIVIWDDYPWDAHLEAYRNKAHSIIVGQTDVLWTPDISRPPSDPTGPVIDTVAKLAGVPRSDLFGKEKFRKFSHARYVIWLILHEDYGQTYSQIARCFNRECSTITEGVAKARQWLPTQVKFTALYRKTQDRLGLE